MVMSAVFCRWPSNLLFVSRVTSFWYAARVQHRLDQAYQEKLDGKISAEWDRKSAEWQSEEQQILGSVESLRAAKPGRLLDAARILELANKAYSLYEKHSPAEEAETPQNGTFELRHRRHKSLSYMQKAV